MNDQQPGLPIPDPIRNSLVAIYRGEVRTCVNLLGELEEARESIARLESAFERALKGRDAALELIRLHYPNEPAESWRAVPEDDMLANWERMP